MRLQPKLQNLVVSKRQNVGRQVEEGVGRADLPAEVVDNFDALIDVFINPYDLFVMQVANRGKFLPSEPQLQM